MSTPADYTKRASHSGSVPPVQETSYLNCLEGRIGYDVAGGGSLVGLVPAQIPSRRGASAQHRPAEMIGRLLLSGEVSG
jgi:hypothetical protein